MHDNSVFRGGNTDFFGINKEKEKLQQYLDLTGAIMVMIGPEQNIIFVNKTGCEILGYSREGIIGKNWFDNYVCVKDRPAAKQAFLKIMAGNMVGAEFIESCMLTKSGEERRNAWH